MTVLFALIEWVCVAAGTIYGVHGWYTQDASMAAPTALAFFAAAIMRGLALFHEANRVLHDHLTALEVALRAKARSTVR